MAKEEIEYTIDLTEDEFWIVHNALVTYKDTCEVYSRDETNVAGTFATLRDKIEKLLLAKFT